MQLRAVMVDESSWGAEHVDPWGNAWAVCECGHATDDEAMACAELAAETGGRLAFETYNATVGGVTWDGKPIPGWEAVTEKVRDGWRTAALAVEKGQQL